MRRCAYKELKLAHRQEFSVLRSGYTHYLVWMYNAVPNRCIMKLMRTEDTFVVQKSRPTLVYGLIARPDMTLGCLEDKESMNTYTRSYIHAGYRTTSN